MGRHQQATNQQYGVQINHTHIPWRDRGGGRRRVEERVKIYIRFWDHEENVYPRCAQTLSYLVRGHRPEWIPGVWMLVACTCRVSESHDLLIFYGFMLIRVCLYGERWGTLCIFLLLAPLGRSRPVARVLDPFVYYSSCLWLFLVFVSHLRAVGRQKADLSLEFCPGVAIAGASCCL